MINGNSNKKLHVILSKNAVSMWRIFENIRDIANSKILSRFLRFCRKPRIVIGFDRKHVGLKERRNIVYLYDYVQEDSARPRKEFPWIHPSYIQLTHFLPIVLPYGFLHSPTHSVLHTNVDSDEHSIASRALWAG